MNKSFFKIAMLIVGSNIIALGNGLEINTSAKDSTVQVIIKAGIGGIGGDASLKVGAFGGLGLSKQFKNGFGLSMDILSAGLQVAPKQGYNYEGKTNLFQITPTISYNILASNDVLELSPFIGLGYLYFNPKNSLNGRVIRFASGTSASPKGVGTFVIPFGIAFGKHLKNDNRIGVSVFTTYTNTDMLDGVVGTLGGDDNRPNRNPHLYEGLIVDYDKDNKSSVNDFWGGLSIYYKIVLK